MRPGALFALAVLVSACAKVGPPRGGPVDELAPRVLAHQPPADAVGVERDSRVEIVFSEAMDRERTQEALFVSPAGSLHLDWSGRRLVLDMELVAGRTYVITVGTGARDLRGNALEKSFSFAFATGAQLNQGRIRGAVYKEHQPASAAHVWAYDLQRPQDEFGGERPAYRTQSGSDGAYEFSRLSEGVYRLLAFADENRNQKWDAGEWLALPGGDVQVGGEGEVRAGDLALVERVAPELRLTRVQALESRRLLLLFSRPVRAGDLQVELQDLEVEGLYEGPGDGRRIYAITSAQEAGRAYAFARLEWQGHSLAWKEPVRGSGKEDRTPPALVSRFPDGGLAAPGDSLELLFSEAMRPQAPDSFWVESDSTQGVEGRWQWQEPTRLVLRPEQVLAPGRYRLVGRALRLRDLAGLAPRDSALSFSFEVPGALASLSGRVPGGALARVVLRHQDSRRERPVLADSAGAFSMAGLLPGRYVLWVLGDRDADGAWHSGELAPFAPAEPYCRRAEALVLKEGEAMHIELECGWQ